MFAPLRAAAVNAARSAALPLMPAVVSLVPAATPLLAELELCAVGAAGLGATAGVAVADAARQKARHQCQAMAGQAPSRKDWPMCTGGLDARDDSPCGTNLDLALLACVQNKTGSNP